MNIRLKNIAVSVLLGAALVFPAGCSGAPEEQTSENSPQTDVTVSTPEIISSAVLQTSALTRKTSGTSGENTLTPPDTSVTTPDTSASRETQSTQDYPIPASLSLSVAPPSTDTLNFTDAELCAFFDDAVFVGDSISLGWRNYVMGKRQTDSNFLGNAQFLVSGSLGAESALWDVTKESVHPMWQGEQMQLWNSVPLTGAKKVFIMFGLNDIGRYSDLDYGIKMAVSNYRELTGRIKANAPDVQFYVISATYVVEGGEKGKVTSENMRKLNEALIDFCNESGYEFLNFADALADSNGNLALEYCSDGYVHQTNAAYDVWTALLKGYAAGALNGN